MEEFETILVRMVMHSMITGSQRAARNWRKNGDTRNERKETKLFEREF